MTTEITTASTNTETFFIRMPHPHCIAIYLEFVAQETRIIPCTAAGAMHFQSEDETTVLDIKAGERFYLVRSDSCPGWFYVIALITRGRHSMQVWGCHCPSYKPCKHEREIAPVIRARLAAERERAKAIHAMEERAAIADIEADIAYRAEESHREAERVTSEVTSEVVETLSAIIPIGTRIYRVASQILFYEKLWSAWFCTCQEAPDGSGVTYGECEHTKQIRKAASERRHNAPLNGNREFQMMR